MWIFCFLNYVADSYLDLSISCQYKKIYATNLNCPLDDEAIREPNKDSR